MNELPLMIRYLKIKKSSVSGIYKMWLLIEGELWLISHACKGKAGVNFLVGIRGYYLGKWSWKILLSLSLFLHNTGNGCYIVAPLENDAG